MGLLFCEGPQGGGDLKPERRPPQGRCLRKLLPASNIRWVPKNERLFCGGGGTWQIRFPIFQLETPGQRGPECHLCQGSAPLCRGSATLRFLEIVSKVRTKGRNFLKFVLDTFWHLQAFFLEKPSSSSRWQSCAAEAQFGPAAKEGRAARTKRLVSKVMRLETDLHSFRSMVQKCGESLPDENISRNSLFCGSFNVYPFSGIAATSTSHPSKMLT